MLGLLEVLGSLVRQVWRVNRDRAVEMVRAVRKDRREHRERKVDRDLEELMDSLERAAYLELRARGVPPERLGHLVLLEPPEQPASRDHQEPQDPQDRQGQQESQDQQGQREHQDQQDPQVHPPPPPPS